MLGIPASAGPSRLVRRVAFWTAVALPFAQLWLLLRGIDGRVGAFVLFGLMAGNVLALIVGHRHLR